MTCDFPSIKDPLDEAMGTKFICSINNEAVLKALFKVKDDQLTFAKAIEVAIEIKDAVKVAKETVHGQTSTHEVNKVQSKKRAQFSPAKVQYSAGKCIRCGKRVHIPNDCRFKFLLAIIVIRLVIYNLHV